jgi:hypothetical protein
MQLTTFYTNYGFHLKTIWTSSEESRNPALKAYAHGTKATDDRVIQVLERTQNNMSKYYNQHHQPQPDYKEGDEVVLNVKNIQTVRPMKKLVPKLYRPFRIFTKISKNAY